MTEAGPEAADLAQFERLIAELRPKLHRYCARITGSVIDGEDVMLRSLPEITTASPLLHHSLGHDRDRASQPRSRTASRDLLTGPAPGLW